MYKFDDEITKFHIKFRSVVTPYCMWKLNCPILLKYQKNSCSCIFQTLGVVPIVVIIQWKSSIGSWSNVCERYCQQRDIAYNDNVTHCFLSQILIQCDSRNLVYIRSLELLACRKRRWRLWMGTEKRSQQVWHDKDPSLLKGHKRRAKFCSRSLANGDVSNEWFFFQMRR